MQYKLQRPVQAKIGTEKYQCTVEWRNGKFIADEPISAGGKDIGPDPFTLLLSSVATCMLVTMRMYSDRKGWNVEHITIKVNMRKETTGPRIKTIIDQHIIFPDNILPEQRTRLNEIAGHCPISKILEGDVEIRETVFPEDGTVTTT
jgi:putative redox protein